ncbi:hypothetical protein BH23GEM11_BH23GEM11_02770 [soil metagenome]
MALVILAGTSGAALALPAAHGAAQSAGAEADSTVVVRVDRMGGFAGVHESWTLHASGQLWFVPTPEAGASLLRTLGADRMEEVRGLLGAGLGAAPAVGAGVECSDCFFYRVRVFGNGAAQEVVLGEHRLAGASPAIRTLVGLLAGRGPPPLTLPGSGGLPHP